MAKGIPDVRARAAMWAAYVAAAWAFLFAAMSFYWAAGGTAGVETLGPAIARLGTTRDPGFIALVWATGILKAIGGVVALALVQSWGRVVPRWLLLSAAWGGGVLALLYGGANLVQHALMVAGVVATPAGLGATAARWHLLLWDPWWLLGGIMFIAAARFNRRSTRAA